MSSLRDPVLEPCGVEHGFGLRDEPGPVDLQRPRQVHGVEVHRVEAPGDAEGVEADAIVSARPGVAVGRPRA